MLLGLSIASMIYSTYEIIREKTTKPIPAENWANEELLRRDIANNVPVEQQIRNAQMGRYKLTETFPEPHRDPKDGKIIIENCQLYYQDLREHGAVQTMKWVKQGKYNLTPEELEQEHQRLDKKFEEQMKLYCACKKHRL